MKNARTSTTSVVVLVVDDEPFVLSCVCSTLEHAGFQVLRAASAEEALRIGSERPEPVDLVVSDVLMPGLNGPGLAERFASMHAETQWLFMAGLPDHPEVLDRILRRGHAFLPKPFVPRTLVKKVQEVLGIV